MAKSEGLINISGKKSKFWFVVVVF